MDLAPDFIKEEAKEVVENENLIPPKSEERHNTKIIRRLSMQRSTVPSRVQVIMLLESLEERRWLGTGHARTLHARDRVRAAWQEVAAKLNSDRSGCLKSWQQWSKYWKDKKAAVKRKAGQIRMARQQAGGAVEDGLVLSSLEERILALMRGTSQKLRIDLERCRQNQQTPPSCHQNQQTPPSPSQSQLASLTERLIGIEEKRVDNERLVIQNQQKMLEIFQSMSEAWTKQAQAMQDLCATVRKGT